jgi:hypothetical protein
VQRRSFWSGFPTLTELLDGLICLRDFNTSLGGELFPGNSVLGWWEFDLYIGLVGLLWLLYFGVYACFRTDPELTPYRHRELDVPMLILFFLSLNFFYKVVADLPIPLFNAEIVTSRFLIVPGVLLLVLASVRMQRLIEKSRLTPTQWVLALGCLFQTASVLAMHSDAWSIARLREMVPGAEVEPIRIVERPDPVYIASVPVSLALSLGVAVAWVVVYWRTWQATRSQTSAHVSTRTQSST